MCAHLLKLLKTHDGKTFITTGEHSKVTPCTLPEWLPRSIIEEMVGEFGSRLRRELVKLRQRTKVLRLRTASTDTRRISLDSIATTGEALYDEEEILEVFDDFGADRGA